MKKIFGLIIWLYLLFQVPVALAETSKFGVHILRPEELQQAKVFLSDEAKPEDWHYLTVPLTLDDLKREKEWREFFAQAKESRVAPIIRLATRFENNAWKIPNRKEIVQLFAFLNHFEWPTSERYVIVFNEVNHAAEWGGQLDPTGYAEILRFASEWAHSENQNYVILPAAMDLAAPNGQATREAFAFLEQMYQADPSIFQLVDVWNSHSYPNPGFSSAPTRSTQNSIRGFLHELAWLKQKTGRELETFITETGWVNTPQTSRWLTSYYLYSLQHVWSHPQVRGVTPFLLKGDPGPFSSFGFLDRDNRPTAQYTAVKEALKLFHENL